MDESLRKIWWIASFPKSGNTLVRLFLNAYVTGFPLDLNAHYQYACIDQQARFYQRVTSKPVNECDWSELAYLRPAMLMAYVHDVAPRDACFKTHNAAVEVDGLPLIPPRLTKQAVYLVRDPRDVAISYARHLGKPIGETIELIGSNKHAGNRSGCEGAKGIRDVILSWSTHVDSWLGIKAFPVSVIRFEDLIADRRRAFQKILPALGFRTIDRRRFRHAMRQTSFRNLQRLEEEVGFREAKAGRFFSSGKSGQWRDVLSRQQVETIEKNHRESMERANYQIS